MALINQLARATRGSIFYATLAASSTAAFLGFPTLSYADAYEREIERERTEEVLEEEAQPAASQSPDGKEDQDAPLQGAPGYQLELTLIPDVEVEPQNCRESEPEGTQLPTLPCPETSGLEETIRSLRERVSEMQERISSYVSSRSVSVGINEGLEQIAGKYGAFSGIDFTLQLVDGAIALRAGMQASYAMPAFGQASGQAHSELNDLESDSGNHLEESRLQERKSNHLLQMLSYSNKLSWTFDFLMGSLDGETFSVEGLDFYLGLGGKLRLVDHLTISQEMQTSQLLYEGYPRALLLDSHFESETHLVPYLIPGVGLGMCYALGAGVDVCAEVDGRARFLPAVKKTYLESEAQVGLRFDL